MSLGIRHLLIGAAVIFTAPHLAAEDAAPAAQQAPAPKADVYVIRPVAQLPVHFEFPARLVSVSSAQVVARVEGVLLEQKFTEGELVRKGDALYRIEPDIYAATLREREADLAVARATQANAQREWERVEALFNDNAVSRKEYDATLAAHLSADASVSAAEARLETAKIDLAYTDVAAPISGIAGIKQSDVGNVVSPGTALVRITQTDPIHAEFAIPDSDMKKIRAALKSGKWSKLDGKEIKARFESGTLSAEGTVDFLSPVVDTATASVKARAAFSNPDNALMAGTFGRIRLDGLVRNNVVMVPQKAILQSPQGTIVFIVEAGKAAVRPVTLGDTEGENYIVEGPLQPGDQVIVNNFFRVKPGMPVAVDQTLNAE